MSTSTSAQCNTTAPARTAGASGAGDNKSARNAGHNANMSVSDVSVAPIMNSVQRTNDTSIAHSNWTKQIGSTVCLVHTQSCPTDMGMNTVNTYPYKHTNCIRLYVLRCVGERYLSSTNMHNGGSVT